MPFSYEILFSTIIVPDFCANGYMLCDSTIGAKCGRSVAFARSGVDRPLFEPSHGMLPKIAENTFTHFLRDECIIPLLINFFLTIFNKNRFIVT